VPGPLLHISCVMDSLHALVSGNFFLTVYGEFPCSGFWKFTFSAYGKIPFSGAGEFLFIVYGEFPSSSVLVPSYCVFFLFGGLRLFLSLGRFPGL
jgi:hypothetical protein